MTSELAVMPTAGADLSELYTALSAAQGEMKGAAKDTKGSEHLGSKKYADLASCWESIREPFSKHGLCVIQLTHVDGPRVTIRTILAHKSGQSIDSELTMTAEGSTPQKIGSAITYARRYGLCPIAGISPEDDDGAEASGRTEPQKGSRESQQRAARQLIEDGEKRTEAALAATKPNGAAKKSTDFDTLKKFKTARTTLGDVDYYRILKMHGADHANEIADPEQAVKCLKAMKGWLNVSEPWTRVENRDKARFAALLAGEGCASIAGALTHPDSAEILTRLELQMSVPQGPREKLKQLEARDEQAFWKIVAGGYGHDEAGLNSMSVAALDALLVQVQTEMELGV
jgi:hypothetical protein